MTTDNPTPPGPTGSAPSPARGEGGGGGPSDNATDDEQRARVAALIGPFPPEVSHEHVEWVRTAAGAMWARDQVSSGLRSAVTLGVLTALNARAELAVHIRRAATEGGLTRTEVAELLHHCAAYAGIPRSNDALRIAQEVFEQLDAEATR